MFLEIGDVNVVSRAVGEVARVRFEGVDTGLAFSDGGSVGVKFCR